MKSSSYSLKVGLEGATRLELLDEIYQSSTQHFLQKVGLTKGMHVADIGCGTGHLLVWLAEQVGPHGSVAAIDISTEQLALAKQKVSAAGLKNINFYECDVDNLHSLDKKFDLVYSKFLLMHLPDYFKSLNIIFSAVENGGFIVCEELENTSWNSNPPSPYITKRNELVLNLGSFRKLNYNMGPELAKLLQKLNCQNITIQHDQPSLQGNQRIYHKLLLEELRDEFIKADLITAQDYNVFMNEIIKLAQDENYHLIAARKFQAAGQKL